MVFPKIPFQTILSSPSKLSLSLQTLSLPPNLFPLRRHKAHGVNSRRPLTGLREAAYIPLEMVVWCGMLDEDMETGDHVWGGGRVAVWVVLWQEAACSSAYRLVEPWMPLALVSLSFLSLSHVGTNVMLAHCADCSMQPVTTAEPIHNLR